MKPRLRTHTLQGEPMSSGLVSYQEAGRLLECSLRTSVAQAELIIPSVITYSGPFDFSHVELLLFQCCLPA